MLIYVCRCDSFCALLTMVPNFNTGPILGAAFPTSSIMSQASQLRPHPLDKAWKSVLCAQVHVLAHYKKTLRLFKALNFASRVSYTLQSYSLPVAWVYSPLFHNMSQHLNSSLLTSFESSQMSIPAMDFRASITKWKSSQRKVPVSSSVQVRSLVSHILQWFNLRWGILPGQWPDKQNVAKMNLGAASRPTAQSDWCYLC